MLHQLFFFYGRRDKCFVSVCVEPEDGGNEHMVNVKRIMRSYMYEQEEKDKRRTHAGQKRRLQNCERKHGDWTWHYGS